MYLKNYQNLNQIILNENSFIVSKHYDICLTFHYSSWWYGEPDLKQERCIYAIYKSTTFSTRHDFGY